MEELKQREWQQNWWTHIHAAGKENHELITYLIYKKDKIAKVPNQILNKEYITQLVAQLCV